MSWVVPHVQFRILAKSPRFVDRLAGPRAAWDNEMVLPGPICLLDTTDLSSQHRREEERSLADVYAPHHYVYTHVG